VTPARRRLCVVLAIAGAFGLLYFTWSWHRISNDVFIADHQWPRRFPYPDRGLLALNNWFDSQYPAPWGAIKLHGEIARVRGSLLVAIGCTVLLFLTGMLPLARRWHCDSRRTHGFEVVPKPDPIPPE
jgi:hypothetical protein